MLTPPTTLVPSFQVKACDIANGSQLLHWSFSGSSLNETEEKGIRRLNV